MPGKQAVGSMTEEAEFLQSVLVKVGLSQHVTVVEEMGQVLSLAVTPEGQQWMRENAEMLAQYGAKLLLED